MKKRRVRKVGMVVTVPARAVGDGAEEEAAGEDEAGAEAVAGWAGDETDQQPATILCCDEYEYEHG